MVGEVLVAECDTKYPLNQHRPDAVFHPFGRPPIGKARREPLGEPDCAVSRTQKEGARIRRDHPAIECTDHLPPFNGCQIEQSGITLCRHRGTPLLSDKPLAQKNFADSEPRCPYIV